MEILTTWVLSVQLWTEPPPKIQLIYTKEFPTEQECFQERARWANTNFKSLCLLKIKNQNGSSLGKR